MYTFFFSYPAPIFLIFLPLLLVVHSLLLFALFILRSPRMHCGNVYLFNRSTGLTQAMRSPGLEEDLKLVQTMTIVSTQKSSQMTTTAMCLCALQEVHLAGRLRMVTQAVELAAVWQRREEMQSQQQQQQQLGWRRVVRPSITRHLSRSLGLWLRRLPQLLCLQSLLRSQQRRKGRGSPWSCRRISGRAKES